MQAIVAYINYITVHASYQYINKKTLTKLFSVALNQLSR